ncbi:MAG: type 1 glutamine amidotransferase domain-containing protein [Pseudomonadota bacterium]|nr:type 1 glutamine amidotransferase domain-containing protein [Pseudomonadales bacterium]MDY6921170.1 type 1 glutamine amidotransferase domain-containing protein [Pseudomonadota bacterium]
MKILMVLTSHDQLGDTGEKTGFWLEEFTSPYYAFIDAGAEVTLASPQGGQPPLDPKSDTPEGQTDSTNRFHDDADAQKALANTKPLAQIDPEQFDALFFPGGHGPLWDLAEDTDVIALIQAMLKVQKPVAAVCHGPAVFRRAQDAAGEPVVKGIRVTGFSNSEEEAVGLTDVVPFSVEDMLQELGGDYRKGADWESHVETANLLITGQNPASSAATAQALLARLDA